MVEVSSVVLSESESPPKVKDIDSESNGTNSSNFKKPLLVSIPKMQNASVGVNMDEEEELKAPQSSNTELNSLHVTLESVHSSSGAVQTVLASNFSAAVSDVMAEPIPSNCIVSNSTMNSGGSVAAGTGVQTMGGSQVDRNRSLMQSHGMFYSGK